VLSHSHQPRYLPSNRQLNWNQRMRNLLLILLFVGVNTAIAQDEQDSAIAIGIKEAMASEGRTEAETLRDSNRRPVETLDFFGITPDMKILELFPGGGWYTKLLAPAMSEKGELHASLGTSRVKEQLVGQEGLERLQVLETEAEFSAGDKPRLNTINEFSFNKTDFDAVLTFRNMHNFDAAGRKNINSAVFDALKPGGLYGIVDHTRRHMQSFTAENRRRADPVVIIKELLDAGFEFADHSDLHYRADDELRYEVGRKSVTGNTDRFTFLFKKPK